MGNRIWITKQAPQRTHPIISTKAGIQGILYYASLPGSMSVILPNSSTNSTVSTLTVQTRCNGSMTCLLWSAKHSSTRDC